MAESIFRRKQSQQDGGVSRASARMCFPVFALGVSAYSVTSGASIQWNSDGSATGEKKMPHSKSTWFTVGMTTCGIAIGAAGVALADFGMSGPGSQLGMPQYMR